MNLALFDLDNTILAGDSDYNWSRFLIKEGYLDAAIHAEKNEKFYADYKEGNLDIFAFVEFQLSHLQEIREKSLINCFISILRKSLSP